MKYVLLFYGTADQQQAWEEISKEAQDEQYAQVGRWFMENGPKLGSGYQLQPPHTATSVHFPDKGDPIIHDGLFIESNEVIGGYVEIDVPDLDEALRMAKTWPPRGTVEIRPVLEMGQ